MSDVPVRFKHTGRREHDNLHANIKGCQSGRFSDRHIQQMVVPRWTNCSASKITELTSAPYICVGCVQNTLHGKAQKAKCRNFDTNHTGSWQESIQFFSIFARVSHALYVQHTLSGKG
jgi:hypothetical protein